MRIIVLSVLSLLIIACEMSNPDGEQLTDTGTTGIADAGVAPAVDSGPVGAATTIAQIRSGTVASDSQVQIEDAIVTAISPGRCTMRTLMSTPTFALCADTTGVRYAFRRS